MQASGQSTQHIKKNYKFTEEDLMIDLKNKTDHIQTREFFSIVLFRKERTTRNTNKNQKIFSIKWPQS